jgi:hypothetical protein
MAGDWIKVQTSLLDKPEVFRISNIVGQNRYEVVGRLLQFWSWIDAHTSTGRDIALTDSDIDVLISCTGFAAALRSVKWLQGRDGALEIPNYERHNGNSAKARALEAEAKRLRRMGDEKCPTNEVENVRPEKRREEKRIIDNTNTKREGVEVVEKLPEEDREPKPKSAMRVFTDLWCERFKAVYGQSYKFDSAKDGKAADSLVKLEGFSPPDLLSIAEKAWNANGSGFWSKHAVTIAGFASKFNQIRSEVGELTAKTEKKW